MTTPLLTFDITKRFPGFSLECQATFESGVTGIFGPSGGGKSTLLSCIAGLLTPDRGEISALGTTVYSSASRKNLPPNKRRFGYVLQDAALFPNMSVRDNILYWHRLTRPDHRVVVPLQLVELFRLSHLMDMGVANLSGGERQRVALARALATSPRVLLLDEPLASLDARFRGVIIEYLRRIWRELGTPMVYVSHSISEVMALADTVLVLADGRKMVHGETSQVLADPAVARVSDHGAFENLLPASISSSEVEEGLSELIVGHTRLIGPSVNRGEGETVTVSIRAGDVIVALDVPPATSARNVISGVIEEIHVVGPQALVYVDIGTRLVVEITQGSLRSLQLRQGQEVYLIIKTSSIGILDALD